MTIRRVALLLALLLGACKPAERPVRPAVPLVNATVVTIRTTIQPEHRDQTRTIVIVGERARDMGEQDEWRLFNVKAKTVTFVDDVARTTHTESMKAIVERRRAATAGTLPSHYPRVNVTHTGRELPMLGAIAHEMTIETGAYQRHLWLASHPLIPPGLFAMMYASDPPSSPLAPMMREVDDELMATELFPLLDHSQVTYGKADLVIDHAVASIARRRVPGSLVAVPRGYRDLTK